MYCKYCGGNITEYTYTCPHCGKKVKNDSYVNNDPGGFGYGLIGFCVPIAGLILYLVWKDEKPNNAGAAGGGALLAVVLWFLMYFIIFISALSTM